MYKPLSPTTPFDAAANCASLDPFAKPVQAQPPSQQKNIADAENLDPFQHVTQKHQQIPDPFRQQPLPPSQPVEHLDSLDPFAAPANHEHTEEDQQECDLNDLDNLDELDRAEALAARLTQNEDGERDVDYENDDHSDDEVEDEEQNWRDDEVEFDAFFDNTDGKLGVLIADVKRRGKNFVMVKMVVDHSPSMREGIEEGATLIAINGTCVEGKQKSDCTAMIRSLGRPLTLRFRKPDQREEMAKGQILARVSLGETTGSGGIGIVGNWKKGVATWSDRYYMWGGASEDELCIFRNEQDFQQHTVQLHEHLKGGSPVTVKVDRFNMTREWMKFNPYRVTHIKCKEYKSYGMLFYFSLKTKPNGDFPIWAVAGKFASTDKGALDRLHESIRHTVRMNKP